MDSPFIKHKIQNREYDLSSHAHQERQQEQITIQEIEKVLMKGDIIEKYPNDPRGESCLLGAVIANKSLHVVCDKRDERLLVITVYRPKQPVCIDLITRAKELKSRG